MTFALTVRETEAYYKRPYRLKAERNVCLALIFIVPFLAVIRIEYIFLTLLPWTLAGSIMIYNYYAGRAPSLTDPILIRDRFIEVDQYLSVASALHEDRFVDLNLVDSIEIIQHVWRTRSKGEFRETRRFVLHMNDGNMYTIDRTPEVIGNAVRALAIWADILTKDPHGRPFERSIEFEPFSCPPDALLHHDKSKRVKVAGVIAPGAFAMLTLLVGFYSVDIAKYDPASFLFFWFIMAIGSILLTLLAGYGLVGGFEVPRNERPISMDVSDERITVGFENGRSTSFPWSSIRGIWASSTEEDPHPFVLDPIIYSDKWGAITFDEHLIYLKIEKANLIRSIYLKKFGYYPNKYWRSYNGARAPSTDNYSTLQKRPKMKWRKGPN